MLVSAAGPNPQAANDGNQGALLTVRFAKSHRQVLSGADVHGN
jgi:hypothetical protein